MDANAFSIEDLTWRGKSTDRLEKDERKAMLLALTAQYENEIRKIDPFSAKREMLPRERYISLLVSVAKKYLSAENASAEDAAVLSHVIPALFWNKNLVKADAPKNYHEWISYAFDEEWKEKKEKERIRDLTTQAGLFASLGCYISKMRPLIEKPPQMNDTDRHLLENDFYLELPGIFMGQAVNALRPLTIYPHFRDIIRETLTDFRVKNKNGKTRIAKTTSKFRYNHFAMPFYPSFFATHLVQRVIHQKKVNQPDIVKQCSWGIEEGISIAEYEELYGRCLQFQGEMSEKICESLSKHCKYKPIRIPGYIRLFPKTRAVEETECFPLMLCKTNKLAESIAVAADLDNSQQIRLRRELPEFLYRSNFEKSSIEKMTRELCCRSEPPETSEKKQAEKVAQIIKEFFDLTSWARIEEMRSRQTASEIDEGWCRTLCSIMRNLNKLGFAELDHKKTKKGASNIYKLYIDFWNKYYCRGNPSKLIFDYSTQIPIFGDEFSTSDDDGDDKNSGIEEYFDILYEKVSKRVEKCMTLDEKTYQALFGTEPADDWYYSDDQLMRTIIRQELKSDTCIRIVELFLDHMNQRKRIRKDLEQCFGDDSIIRSILSDECASKPDIANLSEVIFEESLAWVSKVCTAALFHAMFSLYGDCSEITNGA